LFLFFSEEDNRVRKKQESSSLTRMAEIVAITNGVKLLGSLQDVLFFLKNALKKVCIRQYTIWMAAQPSNLG
jgi:hypothetical protein